jgi:hypothetical protein
MISYTSSDVLDGEGFFESSNSIAPSLPFCHHKPMILNPFDAWIDGYHKACDEIKNELISLKCETQIKDPDVQDVIDKIQNLKREAFSQAPTMPVNPVNNA